MADGIGRIFGSSSYGVGGYVPQRKEESVEQEQGQAQGQQNHEETQIDPNRVMDLLAKNCFMPVNIESKGVVDVSGVDEETEERIAGYMASFEEIYAIIENEFGPELSPKAFDVAMDKLLGIA